MRSCYSFLRIIFVFAALNVYGQQSSESSERIPTACPTHVCEINNNCCCCKVSPCFNPCFDCYDKEFLLKGDFLYWRGTLSGLEGAFGNTSIDIVGTSDGITTTYLNVTDITPNFEWEPGFRVGAEFLSTCFDMELVWTHFDGEAHFKKESGHGKWKLRYDVLDLPFGYKFYLCSRAYIKPFFGVRGAKIDQRLNSHLQGTKQEASTGLINYTINMNDKELFWGIGPDAGLEFDWYMGKNFSLYFIGDIITYYGHVNGKFNNKDTLPDAVSSNKSQISRHFNGFGTDFEIGISWNKYFCKCDNRCHYNIKLGLEQHRIYDFSQLGTDGNLSLDGATLEAGVGWLF